MMPTAVAARAGKRTAHKTSTKALARMTRSFSQQPPCVSSAYGRQHKACRLNGRAVTRTLAHGVRVLSHACEGLLALI